MKIREAEISALVKGGRVSPELHHLWQDRPAKEAMLGHQECHTQGGVCSAEGGGGWREKNVQIHGKTGFCSPSAYTSYSVH